MGLFLRLNLFYEVEARDVYRAYEDFYQQRGESLYLSGTESNVYKLHEREKRWTLLEWNGGWEWDIRRKAQLHVSKALGCLGFLIFVYDGDYWGYELFKNGEVLDHFVQLEETSEGSNWFPGETCLGDCNLISRELPFLSADDVAPFLMQDPTGLRFPKGLSEDEEDLEFDRCWALRDRLNVPARLGGKFGRFEECAVLEFLSLLGVPWEMKNHRINFPAPWHRTFHVGTRK
ncbi:MAG: hypothetical protein L6R28_10270 [Planctomycetes bacterium]|nr:hypothetical protein [Planctomycetota bacterium]